MAGAHTLYPQCFLPFMHHEKLSKLLSIGVDKDIKLHQDCQPNIIWVKNQCTMVQIASDYCIDKSIAMSDDSIILLRCVLKGGLKNYTAFFGLIRASLMEDPAG